MKLSIIIPCHNEQGNIGPLFDKFEKTFRTMLNETEFVYIDDGSTDETLRELKELQSRKTANICVLSFSRNFGKESAILAGLQNAAGETIGIIDGDGQQNPSYIMEMYRKISADPDIDCIAAYQKSRKENATSRFFKHHFYRLMNRLCSVELKEAASDFRVFNRKFRDAVLSLPELCRFSKGIFSWVGFHTEYIEYRVEDRLFGKSKWSFRDLMRYALVGVVAFSTKPLEITSLFGLIYTVIAFISTIYIFIKAMIFGDPVAGYPTIMCVLLFSFGLLFLFIGILGKYVANTYIETKRRPPYFIAHTYRSETKEKSGE